jgi:nucleotide-binding universal stress UspA family protein
MRRTIMLIFHRILFAGDLSERSQEPFRVACSLASGPGAHLHVLNVVEPVMFEGPAGPSRGASLPAVFPADTPARHQEIEGQLRAFYRTEAPIAVDYLVLRGHAADEILRTAHEVDADLIVVGTHGRSGLDRMLCGSVAESVERQSSRPVLIVRNLESSQPGTPIRLILHPTDFSASSWPALGVARALARANQAGLVLLHVEPAEVLTGGSFYMPADLGPAREALAKMQKECAEAGLEGSVQTRLSQGDPVFDILGAAQELGCDLIVMGTHGRTGLRRLLMGSVAESIIRKAPCLTLLVKDVPDSRPQSDHDERAVTNPAAATA